jgi:hypothetical protein
VARLTRYWRDWLFGGGYLMLLFIGVELESAAAWAGITAATLVLATLAWQASLRRLRAIADTPTSRVASAAQGYVELVGTGQPWPEAPVYSPTHHLPCLWYRQRVFVREDNKWRQTEMNESDAPFLLDDGSGRCLLDPIGAEVLSERKETYVQGDEKTVEEILLAGDRLYALGEFISDGGGHAQFDERRELGEIMAEWKADPAELKHRFDLDHDGAIDDREWQLARAAAQREMETRRQSALSRAVSHTLSRPRHGRPFLIAAFPPEKLASRYRLRVWLHGLAGAASLAGLAVALQASM